MGLCQSDEYNDKEKASMSKRIDAELKQHQRDQMRAVKLLLLGAAECGKSTILKQMKIHNNGGFSEEELDSRKHIIYSNTVNAMNQLLQGMAQLNIGFSVEANERHAKVVCNTERHWDAEVFSEELLTAMCALWADPAVSVDAMSRRSEFDIFDSAPHFLSSIDRIAAKNYTPSEQDMLHSRVPTTGIVEVEFKVRGSLDFRVYDVGGQRSERRKWIHCFEGVHAIIYLTAINEFDQVLHEDVQTNRLMESMRLFESICNSRYFIQTSMILFLNKKDLFAEKIKHKSIRLLFPDYNGGSDCETQVEYIKSKFLSAQGEFGAAAASEKIIYVHQTCATDTRQVHVVIDSVLDTIQQAFLKRYGII